MSLRKGKATSCSAVVGLALKRIITVRGVGGPAAPRRARAAAAASRAAASSETIFAGSRQHQAGTSYARPFGSYTQLKSPRTAARKSTASRTVADRAASPASIASQASFSDDHTAADPVTRDAQNSSRRVRKDDGVCGPGPSKMQPPLPPPPLPRIGVNGPRRDTPTPSAGPPNPAPGKIAAVRPLGAEAPQPIRRRTLLAESTAKEQEDGARVSFSAITKE